MHLRYRLLLFFCYCFALKATAQQFAVHGTVYKKGSPEREAQVLVTNLSSKEIRISDNVGGFQIPANIGDTLIFKKLDYASLTFVVYGPADAVIYLQPNILLKEVAIKEESKKNEVKDMMNLYKNQGSYYTLTPSVWSILNSPLTGLYELFGKEPNRARKFQQNTREELEGIEVRKRYTTSLIKRVTGITDDKEVDSFRRTFTPAYEDIKSWTDYELISYIKKSYAYFKNNKDIPPPPRLY